LPDNDIGRRDAMGVLKIAKMRGAGVRAFGAHCLGFGRASARAGIAHRLAPILFETASAIGPLVHVMFYISECFVKKNF
jgi:hypothetical protein